MARCEDEAEQVFAGLRLALRLEFVTEFLMLALEHLVPPQVIERPMLGRRHQPRARILWHAGFRPLLEGSHQRILRQFFGAPDIAHYPRQAGNEPGRLDSPDCFDRAMGVGRSHFYRSHHLGIPYCKLPFDCISTKPAAASCTSGGKSSISCTWRISIISLSPAGHREAHSIASAFDLTWIIQKPPSTSFASAKGPSSPWPCRRQT
jgi:hypothetical protein